MMKFLQITICLLFSLKLFAQDYKITRLEADDYRDYSLEEISELLGENRHLLPLLDCNGGDEFNPFTAPLRINTNRDSLRVKTPGKEIFYTYKNGEFFDSFGNRISLFTDPFLQSVQETLLKLEKIDSTSRLLRQLEESYFQLTISRGTNSFNPKVVNGKFWSGMKMSQGITFLMTKRMGPITSNQPFFDIGVGGDILWNPELKIESIEEDGIKRPVDPAVTLSHEMYHAFDSIRGMLDMGMVSGRGLEFIGVVEYRGVFFENLVRKELGLKFRKHYSDPELHEGEDPAEVRDLLDDHGLPLFVPSPCL
jgi:hypothetical protein